MAQRANNGGSGNANNRSGGGGVSRRPQKWETFVNTVKQPGSLGVATGNDVLFGTVQNRTNCHHHTKYVPDPENAPEKYEDFEVEWPMLSASYIICQVDKNSGKHSYYLRLDAYGDINKNGPGTDTQGDQIMEICDDIKTAYAAQLDAHPQERDLIFKKTKQEKTTKTVDPKRRNPSWRCTRWKTRWPSSMTSTNTPPTRRNTSEGEVDESKSPNISIKIWDHDAAAFKNPRPDMLYVNNGEQVVHQDHR